MEPILYSTLRVKTPKKAEETISFLSIYLMGYRWDQKVNMWSAEDADIQQLLAAEIIKHAPSLLEAEKKYLKEDEALFHFSDARFHRQMQVALRSAVLLTVLDHVFSKDLKAFIRNLGVIDLYQSSRLLAKLIEMASYGLR